MRWSSAAAIGASAMLMVTPALAHPHVWIEMRSDVVFNDQGLITGLNLMWTFDDAYAQIALDGLDTNGDGVYSQAELEPLTKENIESLKDYDFFTVMRFNGEKQPFATDHRIRPDLVQQQAATAFPAAIENTCSIR